MQLRWQIRRGAHFQRILISATARTLSLRRLRDSAGGLSKEYPGRLQLARTSIGRQDRGRAQVARRGYSIRRARAQFSGLPRRYTVIRYRTDRRMYICRTRKSDGDHDYVRLAQARSNYTCMYAPLMYDNQIVRTTYCGLRL